MNKKYTAFNFFLFFLLSFSSLRSDVIARLIKVEGNVFFKRLGMETFSEKAKPGAAIVNGDQIRIGDEGYAAVIYIDDRSIIKIKANTKFSFMDSPNTRTIDLVHGTLLNKINKEFNANANGHLIISNVDKPKDQPIISLISIVRIAIKAPINKKAKNIATIYMYDF